MAEDAYLERSDALEEEDVSDVEFDLPNPGAVEVDRVLDVSNISKYCLTR